MTQEALVLSTYVDTIDGRRIVKELTEPTDHSLRSMRVGCVKGREGKCPVPGYLKDPAKCEFALEDHGGFLGHIKVRGICPERVKERIGPILVTVGKHSDADNHVFLIHKQGTHYCTVEVGRGRMDPARRY